MGLSGSWGAWVPHGPERGIIVFRQEEDPQLRRQGPDAAEAPQTMKQLGRIFHLSPIDEPNAPQLPPRTATSSESMKAAAIFLTAGQNKIS